MEHHYTVMGIVNVTPDSFSDGGAFLDADAAIAHALELVEQGAGILDIGGESTRPGAEPVSEREELRRVLPVLEGLAAEGVRARISIDTSKSAVAAAAIERGASIVNDVTALRADPEMAGVVAAAGVGCCLMHMLGEPRTMQKDPRYDDVVQDVRAFLRERTAFAGVTLAHHLGQPQRPELTPDGAQPPAGLDRRELARVADRNHLHPHPLRRL